MDNHLLTTIDTKKDNVIDPIENGKKQVSEFPKVENTLKKIKGGLGIVLEGIDGSGKGTQSKILTKRLKDSGFDVVEIDFPQYGEDSAYLPERYLNGDLGSSEKVGPYNASWLFAIDRFAAKPKIEEALKAGKIVIINRYVSSNMGHQAGKIHDLEERDKFLEWAANLEYGILGIPRPDAIILIKMPPKIAQTLVDLKGKREYTDKKRDIHEADINHLKNSAEAYEYVANKDGRIVIDCAPNGELRDIEDVSNELWTIVMNIIEEKSK